MDDNDKIIGNTQAALDFASTHTMPQTIEVAVPGGAEEVLVTTGEDGRGLGARRGRRAGADVAMVDPLHVRAFGLVPVASWHTPEAERERAAMTEALVADIERARAACEAMRERATLRHEPFWPDPCSWGCR